MFRFWTCSECRPTDAPRRETSGDKRRSRLLTCYGEEPVVSKVFQVNAEGLAGQKVNRNCVAAEGVHHQHVELARP